MDFYKDDSLDGTHWDYRDKYWELKGVKFDWKCEDDVWHVNSNMCMVVKINYDAEDVELPWYADPVEETSFLSMLPVDVVQNHIWPLIVEG